MAIRVVDRGEPSLLPFTSHSQKLWPSKVGQVKFCIPYELQTRGFRLGPWFRQGKGTLRSLHSQDGKRSPKSQVVRTGFLQPQNFAWSSGPDHSTLKKEGICKSASTYFLWLAGMTASCARSPSRSITCMYS